MSDAVLNDVPKKKRGRPPKSAAAVTADPLDRKLDHFATTRDEGQLDWWEADQTVSPLDTSTFKTQHPDRRFHWSSEKKWDKNGKNYHGWQVYTDAEHPNGIKRGTDFLTWMPEERARRYNQYVARESSQRVRGAQEKSIDKAGRGNEDMRIEGGLSIGPRPMSGMLVNGKFIPSGKGQRGYSPDEIKEAVAKSRESASRGRKYFT